MTKERTEVVARCLARLDGKFISAVDWKGDVGDGYRRRAEGVLETLRLFDAGRRSGGLP